MSAFVLTLISPCWEFDPMESGLIDKGNQLKNMMIPRKITIDLETNIMGL